MWEINNNNMENRTSIWIMFTIISKSYWKVVFYLKLTFLFAMFNNSFSKKTLPHHHHLLELIFFNYPLALFLAVNGKMAIEGKMSPDLLGCYRPKQT